MTNADVSGTITSGGYNLIGDASGTTISGTTTGNLLNLSAGLDPNGLQDNGGPTPTVALGSTSVARDQGNAMGSVTTDQRGSPRPSDLPSVSNASGGDGSDIGAYELFNPNPAIEVQQPAGTNLVNGTSTVDFGQVNVTLGQDLVFTIQNGGGSALNLTGAQLVAISGTNAADFTVTTPPPASVASLGSATFTVHFAPTIRGAESATLAIASNDSTQSPFVVNLTGTGIDTFTQPPTFTAPASNSYFSTSFSATYVLPEAGLDGTLTLTFDNGVQNVITLPSNAGLATQGQHTVIVLPTLSDGVYSVTFSYQDALGNAAATATNTNVTVDTVPPVITLIGTPSPLVVLVGTPVPDYTGFASTEAGLTITQTPAAGVNTFATTGPAEVTLSATDAAGNVGTYQIEVDVRPLNPTISVTSDGLPAAGTPGGPPAGATITQFNQPAIADDGSAAYVALWKGPGSTRGGGIFSGGQFVAELGGQIPGLGNLTYASLFGPIFGNGSIGFAANAKGEPAARKLIIMNGLPGNPLLVVQNGTVAPDANGDPLTGNPVFTHLSGYAVDGGNTAFLGTIAGKGVTAANNVGLWIQERAQLVPGHPASGTFLVLRTGQSIAGGHTIKKIVSFMTGDGSSGQGRGWLNIDQVPQALALVMFTGGGQAIVNALAFGDPVILSKTGPGVLGLPAIASSSFVSYGVPITTDTGFTAFRATVSIPPAVAKPGKKPVAVVEQGIFLGPDIQGNFVPVVTVGTSIGTGLGNATFRVLKDPVLASDGGLAFPATVSTSIASTGPGATNSIWWQPPQGALQLLAQSGQQATADVPAGVKWKTFTSLAIAANRGPIFTATLANGPGGVNATNDQGVWATDFNGHLRLLFRTGISGAVVAGKTLKSFQILNPANDTRGVTASFNDHQQIIWRAIFTDGSEAIVTSEVPCWRLAQFGRKITQADRFKEISHHQGLWWRAGLAHSVRSPVSLPDVPQPHDNLQSATPFRLRRTRRPFPAHIFPSRSWGRLIGKIMRLESGTFVSEELRRSESDFALQRAGEGSCPERVASLPTLRAPKHERPMVKPLRLLNYLEWNLAAPPKAIPGCGRTSTPVLPLLLSQVEGGWRAFVTQFAPTLLRWPNGLRDSIETYQLSLRAFADRPGQRRRTIKSFMAIRKCNSCKSSLMRAAMERGCSSGSSRRSRYCASQIRGISWRSSLSTRQTPHRTWTCSSSPQG